MTSPHFPRSVTLAALACLVASAASPAIAQDHFGYGGLSAGHSRARIDEDRIATSQLGAGFSTSTSARDEGSTAYSLFAGYQFNRYFALEGGYFDLGKFGFTSSTVPAGSLRSEFKVRGVNADVLGFLPLSDRFSVFGRLGAQYARVRDSFAGSGAVLTGDTSRRRSKINPDLGLGLQYEFSPAFLMRGEAERYRISDASGGHGHINVVSLSLVFPFGRGGDRTPVRMSEAAAPAYSVNVPAPVVAPPPPAPMVAVAPPPAPAPAPAPRRVNFSADSLFGFDQSTLSADGRRALDTFAGELRGTRFEVVTVEGHTDRLGSAAYNQALSERRAAAVKAYLVSAGGVDAAMVRSVGKGETVPVTHAEDCKGEQPTARLIACLQPDRRVVAEVAGTR